MENSKDLDKSKQYPEVMEAGELDNEIEWRTAQQILPANKILPKNIFILPVNQTIVFPGMIVPIILSQEKHADTINFLNEEKKKKSKELNYMGIAVLKDGLSTIDQVHPYGVAGRILKTINFPDGSLSILVNCLKRYKITNILETTPRILASVDYLDDVYYPDTVTEALTRTVINQFKIISQTNPLVSEEMRLALANIDGPGKLSDLLATILIRETADYVDFLQTLDVRTRLEKLLIFLKKELEVHNLQTKMQSEINKNVSKQQRDFFLKEQLKLIQKELGGAQDDGSKAEQKFLERATHLKFTEEAQKRFDDELEKLRMMSENSPEYGVTYNYLDWVTSLPWGKSAPENSEIKKAKKILEEDHFGLQDVKKRILEIMAVHKLKKEKRGSVICLVGPPGVGKTSLGKSIARALDRPFYRFSVGGMRDEAEIKGHRRTYIGSMPGKILQGLKNTGVNNPVFMIDEIDKLGTDFRGDPASSLLEVLDPEQNTGFQDNYLDLKFDVSQVLFVATANQLDSIPEALLDRMEVIRIPGYIIDEKIKIAEQYVVPKQLEKNGLDLKSFQFQKDAIKEIITGFAREAGVRSLEKYVEQICRKIALEVVEGTKTKFSVGPKDIYKYLGQPIFSPNDVKELVPGVTVGLAWTAMGGDTLYIESVRVAGQANGGLKLTGQMGKVMEESAGIAWTFVKTVLSDEKKFRNRIFNNSFHLHIPAGAVPKDGPSAGITMASSLYGLVTRKKIKQGLTMTGELTLTGDVLGVGGIREKIVAAKRNNLKEIILPKANKRDLDEVPESVKKGIKFHFVDKMEQVLRVAFN